MKEYTKSNFSLPKPYVSRTIHLRNKRECLKFIIIRQRIIVKRFALLSFHFGSLIQKLSLPLRSCFPSLCINKMIFREKQMYNWNNQLKTCIETELINICLYIFANQKFCQSLINFCNLMIFGSIEQECRFVLEQAAQRIGGQPVPGNFQGQAG